jgi:hypothetical protein
MNLSDDNLNLNRECHITLHDADLTLNCMDELVAYVHHIVATYPAPYTLFVSGGVDSQAMAYIWHKAKVPFTALHVNYMGLNHHDYQEIQQFCEREGIELVVQMFDIVRFLEHNLDSYATRYECASPQICTHMAISTMASGTCIFSGNLPNINGLSIDNTIYGLQRYATMRGRSIIPFFLHGTDKSTRASLVASVPLNGIAMTYEIKCEHYERLGFPIIRQPEKYTGFEQIKLSYDSCTKRVTSAMKLMYAHLPSQRVFDQLFRNKYLIAFRNHYSIKLTYNKDFYEKPPFVSVTCPLG